MYRAYLDHLDEQEYKEEQRKAREAWLQRVREKILEKQKKKEQKGSSNGGSGGAV